MPPLVALPLPAGIAAVAVALSLKWSSEIVAAFGLIGAMSVPAVALLDNGATATGTSFVALVFLGAAVVGIYRRWDVLLIAAGVVSVPQLATLVLQEGEPALARVLAVAAVFGLVYLGTGIARQARASGPQLDGVASLYAGANVALTVLGLHPARRRPARHRTRCSGCRLWRGGNLSLAARDRALGTRLGRRIRARCGRARTVLHGPALVVAWAAETAVLAWLGKRIADTRFQLLGRAYLCLALAYTLVEEARPSLLFEGVR